MPALLEVLIQSTSPPCGVSYEVLQGISVNIECLHVPLVDILVLDYMQSIVHVLRENCLMFPFCRVTAAAFLDFKTIQVELVV